MMAVREVAQWSSQHSSRLLLGARSRGACPEGAGLREAGGWGAWGVFNVHFRHLETNSPMVPGLGPG